MEHRRGESTMEPMRDPAAQGDPHGEERSPWSQKKRRAQENIPHTAKAEAEKPQVQQYITHTKWIGQLESRQRAV